MAGNWDSEEEDEFAMPLTPMIDVVFLLVIFFLTSTVLKPEVEIEEHVKIDLPRTSSDRPASTARRDPYAVLIDTDGNIFLSEGEDGPVTKSRLRQLLLEYKQQGNDSIVIRSDRYSDFEAPANVIRIAAEAGLNVKIGFKNTSESSRGESSSDD